MPSLTELLERYLEASKAVTKTWKGHPDPEYQEAVKKYLEASGTLSKAQREQEDPQITT